MKKFARIIAAASVAFATFASGGAAAQNLVVNGSFEGATAPWVITPGACTFETLATGVPSAGAGGFTTPAPSAGANVLMVDANAPGTCSIQQDVAIPSGAAASLVLNAGYFYRDFGDPLAAGCSVSVDVTTTGGALISNVFTGTGGANIAMAPRGPVNLSAQAGNTVRIIATMTSCAGGPVGLAMDSVSLVASPTVPTLGEWAMILLALLLAGAAAYHLRGRPAAV